MIHQAVHHLQPGTDTTACGRYGLRLARTDEPAEVTCKRCLHKLNAPKFVGQNRNRDQYQVRCVGGPWDGQDVVMPHQTMGPMSLPIRVGEFTGRYNLNTGTWVPKESAV
jgi:hypothetical protein